MKKQSKKLIIGISFIVMLMCMLCFGASAETQGYYTYNVKFGEATIVDVDKSISGDVVIPSYLGGYPVTVIGDSAFSCCDNITGIKVPDSVKIIEGSAFWGCTSLVSIELPDSIETIEISTFYDCYELKNIDLPDNLKIIGKKAFLRCYALESIVIPEGVESIGDEAFWRCENLSGITLPDSLTSIGMDVFYGTEYQWNEDNWENGVLYIGNHLILGNEDIETYTVKEGTKTIAAAAFYFMYEDSEGDSYYPCKLTDITFPESLVSVCGAAFYGCKKLTNIRFNEGLEIIEVQAFELCSGLTEITLPQNLRILDHYAFEWCKNLSVINIGDNIETLGEFVFKDTAYSADERNWEDGVLYLGAYLLDSKSNVVRCDIKPGTKYIAPYAFDRRIYFAEVTFPDSLKIIGNDAFYYTALTKAEIPFGVTTIESCAFGYCEKLESATIPGSVTKIGAGAFGGCKKLADVNIPLSVKYLGAGAFKSTDITDAYISAEILDADTFRNCYYLNSVVVSKNVKEIWGYAFLDSSIKSLYLYYSEDLKIREYAFSGCGDLNTVYFYGTEEQWNSLKIDKTGNGAFLNADIIFMHAHEYSETVVVKPTCTSDGKALYTCSCGESYSEIIPAAHSYVATTTPATCTENGKTVYTCSCGDAYSETISAKGHSYTVTTTPATCTENGKKVYTCSCGDTYSKIISATGHSHTATTTPATCTENGQTVYICFCGDTYSEIISATGHVYQNGICNKCGDVEDVTPDVPEDPSDDCSCNCHKKGISGLIYKILLIFWKIFKLNPVCSCGVAHY